MPIPIIDPSQATTNERLARLEAIAEQHKQNLISLEDRITRVEDRITRVEDRITRVEDHIARVEERIVEDRLDKSFRWLVGILFTILLTILGATVTILLNLPK